MNGCFTVYSYDRLPVHVQTYLLAHGVTDNKGVLDLLESNTMIPASYVDVIRRVYGLDN